MPNFDCLYPLARHELVRFEIGRKDEWRNLGKGHGRELNVPSASPRGVPKPKGLRYDCIPMRLTLKLEWRFSVAASPSFPASHHPSYSSAYFCYF